MKSPLLRFAGVCACLLIAGCGVPSSLDTSYGSVKRPSVNGVGVFVDMLRATGRKVDVLPAISNRLSRYSTVIIFHEGFDALEVDTVDHLNYHGRETDHTVLVVLRDCDWSIDYWAQIAPQYEGREPALALAARHASTQARAGLLRLTSKSAVVPVPGKSSESYRLDAAARTGIERAQQVRCLSDHSDKEDSSPEEIKVDFPLRRRLTMPADGEDHSIWKSGDEPLLLSFHYDDARRYMVLATSAPLLNAGLVNRGNRQLTEKLIEEIDGPDPVAVITSSLLLSDDEDISMWRFAKIFPHPWILGQSLLALVLFCWWRWPIFGRPHTDQNQETKRFGHHVAAVGELLARTGNVRFALQRIQEWQRVQEHRKGRRG